jgi:hypothetical protein
MSIEKTFLTHAVAKRIFHGCLPTVLPGGERNRSPPAQPLSAAVVVVVIIDAMIRQILRPARHAQKLSRSFVWIMSDISLLFQSPVFVTATATRSAERTRTIAHG